MLKIIQAGVELPKALLHNKHFCRPKALGRQRRNVVFFDVFLRFLMFFLGRHFSYMGEVFNTWPLAPTWDVFHSPTFYQPKVDFLFLNKCVYENIYSVSSHRDLFHPTDVSVKVANLTVYSLCWSTRPNGDGNGKLLVNPI